MTEERAKELAIKLLEDTNLYGEDYYKVEDYIIQVLMGEEPKPINFDIISYHSTIRAEIDSWASNEYGITLENEEIEDIAEQIYNHFSECALNLDFIRSIINKYILKRKLIIQGHINKEEN